MNQKFLVTLILFLSITSLAYAGGGTKSERGMQAHNEKFRQNEAQRPPSETSYKNTNEYKEATPKHKERTDRLQERNLRELDRMRRQ